MAVTLMAICDGIEAFCAAASGIKTSQSQASGEITEDVPLGSDKPVLQVYWVDLDNSVNRGTERVTFGGGSGAIIREVALTFHVDVIVRQRSWIGEDLKAVLEVADAIETKLETIKTKPYFGVVGIQSVKWTAEMVQFDYGMPVVRYVGNRFVLQLEVF